MISAYPGSGALCSMMTHSKALPVSMVSADNTSKLRSGFRLKDLFFTGRLFLAPMAGVGDSVFRRTCVAMGANAVISEMVSAKAVMYGNKKTLAMLEKDPVQVPQALQLFGSNPAVMADAVDVVRSRGWEWIDLNAGCPVRKVTKTGAGAALLNDLGLLREVLHAMRERHAGVLSLKIRSGWSEQSPPVRIIEGVGRLVDDTGVDMVTIHARTRAQGYSGRADWGKIKILKHSTSAFVVGNGDVVDCDTAAAMLEQTGCDAVMIGRASIGRPWVFSCDRPEPGVIRDLIVRHFDLLVDALHGDEAKAARMFRRHLIAYAKGATGASRMRWQASRVLNRTEVIAVADMIGDALRWSRTWV